MHDEPQIIVKSWAELDQEELAAMNQSHKREWKSGPMSQKYHGKNVFFLLKDPTETILAQGQLVPIEGVIFNGETFNILGIGGVIANRKKKGYGRKIMSAIKDYLIEQNKTGVGFTGVPEFYLKCGFSVDKEAIKRFAQMVDGKRITNVESDHICFLDAEDRFVWKVLENRLEDVLLPRGPDW